jgi:hypothetical protein
MAERSREDSTLVKRLDRAPFETRAEAEKRRDELNSKGTHSPACSRPTPPSSSPAFEPGHNPIPRI